MALHKLLFSKRPSSTTFRITSQTVFVEDSPIPPQFTIPPPNAASINLHRKYLTSPDSKPQGFFRRLFHRKSINNFPDFFSFPVTVREKLADKQKDEVKPAANSDLFKISNQDAAKVLRIYQMEKLKLKLREIEKSSISYNEFVEICIRECGNKERALEFAKILDQSGNVAVLGNIVFLRPDQVAKSMESLILQSVSTPDDPRREHLEHLELQKLVIDEKARAQVNAEMSAGLVCFVANTIFLMWLTFWLLSWDVMEPVCYFYAAFCFSIRYGWFLRTKVQPTFKGYSDHRFKTKQMKLMGIHNFNIEKYNQLRKIFFPKNSHTEHYKTFGGEVN